MMRAGCPRTSLPSTAGCAGMQTHLTAAGSSIDDDGLGLGLGLEVRVRVIFFKNTSFPYSKSYSIDRKHISDTLRHSRRVQNTCRLPKSNRPTR